MFDLDVDPEAKLRDLEIWESRERCEGSLYQFLKEAWPQFDPAPFVDGWHLRAIAEHLEAVSSGEIKRLLINIPPRHSKTSLCSIAWPVWTWALPSEPDNPLVGPGVRFLCASYGASKAQQDAVTARRLIASKWFQERWGERFLITKDRDNQEQFDTSEGGGRISTGIPESLGKGGIIRLCFPWGQTILTEDGPAPIGDIVENRRAVRVRSVDRGTGQVRLSPITAWHRNPSSHIIRLTFDNGLAVSCTPCHRFLVARGEWKAARDIPIGAALPAFGVSQIGSGKRPCPSGPDLRNVSFGNTEARGCCDATLAGGKYQAGSLGSDLSVPVALSSAELSSGGESAVSSGIIDVLRSGAVLQVVQSCVAADPVLMADLLTNGARSEEGCRHELMNENVVGHAVFPQTHSGISLIESGPQDARPYAPFGRLAPMVDDPGNGLHAPKVRDLVVREANNAAPDFVRLVRIDYVGHVDATYCITVADDHNFLCGDDKAYLIASNCDDPHKTDEVESQAVLDRQVRAYNEVWRTRSNDPQQGAEVIIMQRLGEGDLSGYLLEHDGDVVHLCLPTLYESDRRCVTSIGWADPREEDGELLWPERFDAAWAEKQKESVGTFAWVGQFQQRPAPRGGGIVKDDWWKLWPPRGEEMKWTNEEGVLHYPQFSFTMAYLDTAFTTKDENAWCALTRWGVFEREGTGCAMLCGAWRERPTLKGLVDKVVQTCRRGRVDVLMIENKAGAEWVKQEIMTLMRSEEWSIVLDEPKGDKVARLHRVTVMFENGLVYAPAKGWADMVISEVSNFPKGRWMDLTDTVSGALGYLRRSDLLRLKREVSEEEDMRLRFRGKKTTIAEEYGA